MSVTLLLCILTWLRSGFWTTPACNQSLSYFFPEESITEKSMFMNIKKGFQQRNDSSFIQYWPFYLPLWQQMLHTRKHTHKQGCTLADGIRGRRITRRLMRWSKSDPTYQRGQAMFCQSISWFLAWNSANFCRYLAEFMSFHVCQRKTHALCVALPSVIFANELTALMCHKNVMSHVSLCGT